MGGKTLRRPLLGEKEANSPSSHLRLQDTTFLQPTLAWPRTAAGRPDLIPQADRAPRATSASPYSRVTAVSVLICLRSRGVLIDYPLRLALSYSAIREEKFSI